MSNNGEDISEIINLGERHYEGNEIRKIDSSDYTIPNEDYNRNFKKSLDEDKKNRTEGFIEGLKKLFSNY